MKEPYPKVENCTIHLQTSSERKTKMFLGEIYTPRTVSQACNPPSGNVGCNTISGDIMSWGSSFFSEMVGGGV
jgi:hypothetical protein